MQCAPHFPMLKPSLLLVSLICKGLDSPIVGSKLVWEDFNERALVVDAFGSERSDSCKTGVRQEFSSAPMHIHLRPSSVFQQVSPQLVCDQAVSGPKRFINTILCR